MQRTHMTPKYFKCVKTDPIHMLVDLLPAVCRAKHVKMFQKRTSKSIISDVCRRTNDVESHSPSLAAMLSTRALGLGTAIRKVALSPRLGQ
jgi:hypothetical protein